ncbi:MAG: hemolysin family protein [Candidatus Gastranaerophilaceae bacterium]
MDQSILFNILVVAVLIFANAFFVASEFALVKVRKTKLEQLSNEGSSSAKVALDTVENMNDMLAAIQLGITIASIALGWVGEATVVQIIQKIVGIFPSINLPITSHAIAVPVAFTLVTFLHVLLGEQVPKCMAIQYPEKFALVCARPIKFFEVLFKPFVWVLATCNSKLLKLCCIDNPQSPLVHSTEELDMIVDASYNEGVLNETEAEMLHNMFKFSDLTAKQIMVPRTDMMCIDKSDITYEELTKITLENQYTRYPVYEENIDKILGFIHVKDLYAYQLKNEDFNIDKLIRPLMLIPETMTLDNLMIEFKKRHGQMAIVVDEFGGTSGLITLEDVLEEIIGEVQDEFDTDEEVDIKEVGENTYVANAMMRIDEIAEFFDINEDDLDFEDIETIGGLVVKILGRIAQVGDVVTIPEQGLKFTVQKVDGARVTRLVIIKNPLTTKAVQDDAK